MKQYLISIDFMKWNLVSSGIQAPSPALFPSHLTKQKRLNGRATPWCGWRVSAIRRLVHSRYGAPCLRLCAAPCWEFHESFFPLSIPWHRKVQRNLYKSFLIINARVNFQFMIIMVNKNSGIYKSICTIQICYGNSKLCIMCQSVVLQIMRRNLHGMAWNGMSHR